ncbi:MAG: hypothetical protein KC431_17825, partial [Myxococcales bacterium]|nr:hypothetical protein [Myxococcales bacterium]
MELFRDDPTLVVRLVQRAFDATLTPMPERLVDRHANLSVDAAQLRRVDPRTADLVLIVRNPKHPSGGAVIIVEVQIGDDPDKLERIASYLGVLIDREHLPIHIGTVALEDRVARKLDTWSFGTAVTISTFVLDRHTVPPLINPQQARKYSQEAVLSAAIHGHRGNLEPVRVALQAVGHLGEDRRRRYTATILAALSNEDFTICVKELPMNRRVEISRIERRSAFFVHGLEEGTRK